MTNPQKQVFIRDLQTEIHQIKNEIKQLKTEQRQNSKLIKEISAKFQRKKNQGRARENQHYKKICNR